MTINYITKPIEPKRTYPWIGRLDTEEGHSTVLFIGPKYGFCLDSTDQANLGYNNLDESDFVPCSITLSSL